MIGTTVKIVLFFICLFSFFIAWSCCAATGAADDKAENYRERYLENSKENS